ncbi:MAG TPA: ABC transporter substrate-binding protein [Solirubrobacterales bacterium]|nr:ABC transporter substrate-binding protein [Solirubrobacterales bacterium]
MKIRSWLAGLVAVAVLLAGCGEGSKVADAESAPLPTSEVSSSGQEVLKRSKCRSPARGSLRVSLNSYVGPDNVAVWVAKLKGFFSDVDVRTRVLTPIVPNRPVRYLTLRVDDVALAQVPQAVIAKAAGAPIIVLGTLISQPTAAMIWLKSSGINSVAEMKGKTVAYPGVPFQKAFLEEILVRAGLEPAEVRLEPVGYRLIPTLLSREADAVFGSWNIEGMTLESRGAAPVAERVEKLGIPGYQELAVVARTECVAKYPRLYSRFMAALTRGVAATREHPAWATRLIEENGERNRELEEPEVDAQVAATLPLLVRDPRIDPEQSRRLLAWMYQRGLIEREVPASEIFTNSYLP